MTRTLAMLGTASVLALAAATAAQAGTIAGHVMDGSQSVGLEGATVRIVETGQTVSAGSDGAFRVVGLAAGTYTLRVSYVGTEPTETTVTLASVSDTVSPVITLGEDVDYIDNILVIGQRGALNSALSRQRANDGNVAVLTSDAIGQFPDENVAEAARRAVGVNVLNDQGEGRFVSIRGLSPNLVSTSINGVRLTSPEAEDRQVGLDVIDADVLSSVVINKTLTPDMDGDSVGGNVEIETMSGLDVDDLYFRARAATLYSDGEEEFGWRGSANFANNFLDGRLGVAGSLSYQERVFGSESFEVDGGWEIDEDVAFPNEVEMRNYQITRERTTAVLNFDYRASNELSFYLHSTYSDFSDQEYRNRVEVKLEDAEYDDVNSAGDIAVLRASEMEIDRDVKDRLESQLIFATDVGGEWLNGNTTIDWSLSYVHSEEEEPNRLDTDFSSEFTNGETFIVDSSNPLMPSIGYEGGATTQAVFDASNYGNEGFELTNGLAQDREYAGAVNVRQDFTFQGAAAYVQGGVRMRLRDKKYALDFEVYDSSDALTLADVERTVDYSQSMLGPVPNPSTVRDFFFANRDALDFEPIDSIIDSQGASYGISEDITAGYVMGGWDNGPVRIVGGLRVEQTDVSGYGYEVFLAEEDSVVGGVVQTDDTLYVNPQSVSDDYTDVLPSVLGRFELAENVIARAGYYASIQRPNPDQFAPRILVEQNDDDEVEGEFGNPDLERLEAQNFDVSIEWYPNNDAVVYLGYFYKDLENIIAPIGYNDVTLNGRFFDEAESYINLPEGDVSGLEFNYQQALDFLPVEGFIVGFNATWTDSSAVLSDGRTVALPGQSDRVWNAQLGYDHGPWDLRAVLSTRSEYLDEIRGGADEDRFVLEHSQLDLSAKYELNDNLQIFADLKNVTDEPYRAVTRPDGIDRIEQFEEYGWSSVLGLRFTY